MLHKILQSFKSDPEQDYSNFEGDLTGGLRKEDQTGGFWNPDMTGGFWNPDMTDGCLVVRSDSLLIEISIWDGKPRRKVECPPKYPERV